MASFSSRADVASDWLTDRFFRVVLAVLMRMSFDRRREAFAWLASQVLAPLVGYRKRVRNNLQLIFPDMPKTEIERLTRAVPANAARTVIEIYSGQEFVERVARAPLTGPGVPALEEAHRTNRPVLLVTGHIGNYDAIRASLISRGYRVGGLYRPMNNRFFDPHYVDAISQIGKPLFPRGRKGLSDMIRFLKGGGMVGIVLDQHTNDGEPLFFMGKKAMTSLSVGQMALRYDALVVPTYGIRRADGDFDLIVEAPIENSDAMTMTQALNNSLEQQVRTHIDQWMWTHRRWRIAD